MHTLWGRPELANARGLAGAQAIPSFESTMTTEVFPTPILTVDVVLLTMIEGCLHVALARRPNEPFSGQLALPGGYVHADKDENTFDTAKRVLRSKIGVDLDSTSRSAYSDLNGRGVGFEPAYLEQAFTESGPTRDPRGWSASVVYLAVHAADDLEVHCQRGLVELWDVDHLPTLAFDHAHLIELAVRRLRTKSSYTSLAAHLLPKEFTIPQVQLVFEALLGQRVNAANFRRKILETGALTETRMIPAAFRPAQGYRLVERLTDFGQNLYR